MCLIIITIYMTILLSYMRPTLTQTVLRYLRKGYGSFSKGFPICVNEDTQLMILLEQNTSFHYA